jgi:hypothetical protein
LYIIIIIWSLLVCFDTRGRDGGLKYTTKANQSLDNEKNN